MLKVAAAVAAACAVCLPGYLACCSRDHSRLAREEEPLGITATGFLIDWMLFLFTSLSPF